MKKNIDTLNKLQLETVNTGVVHLWLEGMFWKAYERSAYIFVRRINGYKPYKKWIKSVGGEVVAIGFPTKAFDKLVEGRIVEHVDEKHCLLTGFTVDVQELKNFQEWKKKLVPFPYAVVGVNDSAASGQGREEDVLAGGDSSVMPVPAKFPVKSLPKGEVDKPVVSNELVIRLERAEAVVGELRRFRIESATPLQCMIFLSKLMGRIEE